MNVTCRPKVILPRTAWRLSISCMGALAVLGLCQPAHARQTAGPEFAVTAAISSDFVSRGISLSEGDPAISAGVDVAQGLFYVAAWAGNASFDGDPDTKAELDLYMGVRPSIGGFDWDFSLAHYAFLGEPTGADYSFSEVRGQVSRTVGAVTWGALIYWSPDFFGAADKHATYVEVNATVSPAEGWQVSGGLARQKVSSNADYNTWNLGAAYQLTSKLSLDVRYYDTDAHDLGNIYNSRVVASLAAAF